MKDFFELLCELARRRPRNLRDSDLNSLGWFPSGKPEVTFPDLRQLFFGFSSHSDN